jgi:hypothetical protein
MADRGLGSSKTAEQLTLAEAVVLFVYGGSCIAATRRDASISLSSVIASARTF